MIFEKLKINKTNLKNRIVISPMCQYSANNGNPSKWHYKHLSNLSATGASMVMLESTAIEKSGKISDSDLCLYNDTHVKNLSHLIKYLKKRNDIKLGIQISHSGRKGSSHLPWEKFNMPLKGKNSWQTYAPSAIRRDNHWPFPKKLTIAQIKKLIEYFKKSAILANKSGFDCLEIHMAHGYLLHQFFSPISNKRDDNYGGNLENRSRLLIEIASTIRKVWPKNKILGARITGSDHLKKGVKVKDSIYLIKKLKKQGIDYVSVSSGGILPKTNMKKGEAFRAKMTKKIKNETNMITTTSGEITKFTTVENLIKSNTLDFITIARPVIKNPHWILHLAKFSKKNDLIPKQYSRII
tara:strand:+ start:358 stop:1416 length:1059 start_codon:yes stop_codon:yes gene_type:complete